MLLHKYEAGLRHFPLIKRLNRKAMQAETDEREDSVEMSAEPDTYYTLGSSGRRVRSVSAI